MKKFYLYLIVVTVLVICFSGCKRDAPQPNIVLIVLDTLRADHLPVYGYSKDTSPFISKIASQSIIFNNAFSASSWTAPATASILTSLYPFQHGVIRGFVASHFFNFAHKVKINQIPDEIKTITEVLRENGYFTCGVSDNINIGEELGFTQGFDKFKLFNYKDDKKMNPQLKKWAEEIRSKQKYFMYIHYNDCHSPYHERKPWYKKMSDPKQDEIARYDSEINYVDEKIKEMFEYFNWDKNTLLIITSDHGEEFWDHNHFGHGYTLFSEVIKIPLLIYFPESDRVHKRLDVNVSNIDILPTVRNYLKIEEKEIESGQNLLPLILGKNNKIPERYILSHLSRLRKKPFDQTSRIQRCTIYKEWKSIFINHYNEGTDRQLFNLKNDPGERLNIYESNKKMAKFLQSKFINFEKRCKKFKQKKGDIKMDKDQIDELKTLGYIH